MTRRLLLTVEDTFLFSKQGLIVLPSPQPSEYSGLATKLGVILIKPDGSELQAFMHFILVRVSPPPVGTCPLGCVLEKLSKADVPIGTEIWYDKSA